MKRFPIIIFILGLLLLALYLITPDKYEACHSDLIIAGYNNSQNCLPDIVYQLAEAAKYVGIGCIFVAATLKFYLEEIKET